MNRRFDLKGWGPILAAAVFGFVLGTSGVTVLWPKMWEGAKLSDSLGFWGGIFGGAMTLVAAIIAFRPARDQMLIARAAAIATDLRDLRDLATTIAALISIIEEHMILVADDLAFTAEYNYLTGVYDDILNNRIQLIFISTVEIRKCIITFEAAAFKFSHEDTLLEDAVAVCNAVQLFVRINREIRNIENRDNYNRLANNIKAFLPIIESKIAKVKSTCGRITKEYARRARDIELQLGPH
ncbi:hypothetical protein SAMN02745172_03046 [Pseudoxanthobacter soli DSM 19599]|uniref:Uncharacterized protein n=1 Tax=Pseudoxanthobacter soli DSM 19599 TaxID=1123029 RepID=A0A1M7ZNC8_9HYPH|nr:hypothetical protein [Pseudoxanthobacter soli]SHO66387.1 hypothetical protein SAMN02745172_03046 [Pseudoxanthobacter soli DSM 19599]